MQIRMDIIISHKYSYIGRDYDTWTLCYIVETCNVYGTKRQEKKRG